MVLSQSQSPGGAGHLDCMRSIDFIVDDLPSQLLSVCSQLRDTTGIIHLNRFAEIHLEAPEVQLLEEGVDKVYLLIVG